MVLEKAQEESTKEPPPGPVVRISSVLVRNNNIFFFYLTDRFSYSSKSAQSHFFFVCRTAQSGPARRKLFARGECAGSQNHIIHLQQ